MCEAATRTSGSEAVRGAGAGSTRGRGHFVTVKSGNSWVMRPATEETRHSSTKVWMFARQQRVTTEFTCIHDEALVTEKR